MEKKFVKYQERGSMHWRQMMSRDVRRYNAGQQANYEWIIKMLGNPDAQKILDIGCGDGGLTYQLSLRGAEVTGVDNEPLGIEFAKSNVASTGKHLKCDFVVGSAYELPFPDNSFDQVVSCEVIEHVEHPDKMVSEAYRVLKPGGKFVFTTPHRITENPTDPNHFKEYFPSEIGNIARTKFGTVSVKLYSHIFWFGLYTYTFRRFSNRQFGMWFINMLALWFGYNPFLIEYQTPKKFDRFTQILVIAEK